MQYMGGKFRQSKAIVECLRPVINPETVYVEPFCGAMWSATRVIRDLHPKVSILNDINKPLMLLWDKCIKEGVDWLPLYPSLDEYNRCKELMDENNPLTAYYGFGFSFGGAWFTSWIKPGTSHNGDQRKSIEKKVNILRSADLRLYNYDYRQLPIPSGSVVYCDPPYENRTKAYNSQELDYPAFWQWVRDLSKRCFVFTSCFECPDDFRPIYEWGDTVVRHHASKGTDGTNEKLVILK